jgi:two-component system response regulator TctD
VSDRILIVEDNPATAHLLALELARLGYPSRTAMTGADALMQARTWKPQLMLLDLELPDRDGIGVLADLRAEDNALPVICVTARGGQADRVGGLLVGADDYVVKPFDIDELDARITAVLRRTNRTNAQALAIGTLRLVADDVRIYANDELLALTPREVHVLRELLAHAGQVVTKSQLTSMLMALNESIGEKTIEVYIHRLRNKIHGHGVEIVTARGFGYMLQQAMVARAAGDA